VEKREFLYEGKAKKLFRTSEAGLYLVEYKDDATAFDGRKKGTIVGKGVVNNQVSAHLFQLLERYGVPNHFVELIGDREMLVRGTRVLALEVVVRNIAAGSLSKRLGLEEGLVLPEPVVETYYKNDELHDPLINYDHIRVLGLATPDEVETMRSMALRVNEILRGYLFDRGIDLVDFKLEFGLSEGEGRLLLVDEISPDTCRLWDRATGEKLDKDRFRHDLGGVEEAYAEIMRRLIG
jgi:phosphoribosylaminoimidazole-succinocarboxamide synthase